MLLMEMAQSKTIRFAWLQKDILNNHELTKVYQLDVKSTILNGELEEELEASAKSLEQKIDHYFQQTRFIRSLSEPSLYLKKEGTHDFLILCFISFHKNMMKEYEMTNLCTTRYFLGIQVQQSDERIFISQEKYAENLLKKFNMLKSIPMDTASIYRSVATDIVHDASVVSRFMSDPSNHHFAAVKRILEYIQGTKRYGIRYTQDKEAQLVGYTDSGWAGAIDD
ncbi:hypothetical protein Prudu_002446 [Prunus dulcis]|uniref:Reverse transcriptase Ty1/copia-type domain-containing protein n=1 Tax=Prunus dulcis TaxID=3755 RepID=A0A4Y1QQV8_PRUDU|nr:hypothetical protein Prudu_002446 [Prunus dulcis]